MKRPLIMSALAAALLLPAGFVLATDQAPAQTEKQEQVFSRQLMTQQERIEHRAKMRAAKTVEEREQIRKEHHESMKERAKERGITLPDEPPVGCNGMGPCCGMGHHGGMGLGSGMGPGSMSSDSGTGSDGSQSR